MAIHLNHTIVATRNKAEAAQFFVDVLGLATPTPYGPFLTVQTDNDVSLDFMDTSEPITSQHYAFLVSEAEFDTIFERIRERNIVYRAGPMQGRTGQINTRDGGRGLYFDSADGHVLEILTRPYGSGG